MRNNIGQFQKGYSGNAGGRPKDEYKVAELADHILLSRRYSRPSNA